MNYWSAIGVFMLGAAAGAVLTWINFAARIYKPKRLVESLATQPPGAPERPDHKEERKSA